ncbi:hypothetical protein RJT34_18310 [Clitoria ternatea]|uniref:Uncharacterized protein n=1 Tax=Clitoria ternatea TaxID=43366 RepID=A0AAN9JAV6_CLITE
MMLHYNSWVHMKTFLLNDKYMCKSVKRDLEMKHALKYEQVGPNFALFDSLTHTMKYKQNLACQVHVWSNNAWCKISSSESDLLHHCFNWPDCAAYYNIVLSHLMYV